ncbi:holo-ACP synthase [Thermogemmatispora sp.]|uniref:holo-ACP synthase n=1 Tax=Thermogemmatispora sp. TaxID=1968838 RepID=UPI001DDF41F4|nr:holo-ACP synthase [Thermogemmatispora sp.]MBX5450336.1 holo-ACP synthase [Thermogemmatispora sp.]
MSIADDEAGWPAFGPLPDEGTAAPLLFTPLVSRLDVPPPAWLFGSGGLAALPAPLLPPHGVNVAVGIDIIEVARVARAYARHGERFLQRVFTDTEVLQCRGRRALSGVSPLPEPKPARLAGRFAAKEAISKALGTGLRGVAWREMEIVQLRSGRPSVRLYGRARRRAEELGLSALDVSIADLQGLAIAVAVAVAAAVPTAHSGAGSHENG